MNKCSNKMKIHVRELVLYALSFCNKLDLNDAFTFVGASQPLDLV